MQPITLFLARHAEPDRGRTDLIYHELPGPPLTEVGQQEASALGEFLRSEGVQHIFCSPFERCERTARIAAELAGIPITIFPELAEIRPQETIADVQTRISTVLEAAIESAPSGPVVLLTHGAPVMAFLGLFGMDARTIEKHRTFDHRNPLPHAGVWRVTRIDPSEPWDIQLAFMPATLAQSEN